LTSRAYPTESRDYRWRISSFPSTGRRSLPSPPVRRGQAFVIEGLIAERSFHLLEIFNLLSNTPQPNPYSPQPFPGAGLELFPFGAAGRVSSPKVVILSSFPISPLPLFVRFFFWGVFFPFPCTLPIRIQTKKQNCSERCCSLTTPFAFLFKFAFPDSHPKPSRAFSWPR